MAPTKPALRPLKTSRHMAFPSELYYSPPLSSGCCTDSSNIKTESGSQSSLSPPPSYTEFLKALTPVFSPGSAASRTGFPRASSTSSAASSPRYPSPLSNPSSTTSATFPAPSERSSRGRYQKQKPRHLNVAAAASIPPASPLSAPLSSRPSALTPVARSGRGHYLHRPPPYKPCLSGAAFADSPRSAASASVVRSPYPPPELRIQYVESPRTIEGRSSASSPNIQHVVTTTVTFKRSPPLGPPPRGKRMRSSEERRYD